MSTAVTLDEIETAAVRGLIELIDVRIAYVARRENGVWKISQSVGLIGEIARVAVPEDQIRTPPHSIPARRSCSRIRR
jgi:hypothetical protein